MISAANTFGQMVDSVKISVDSISKIALKTDSLLLDSISIVDSSLENNNEIEILEYPESNDIETTVNYNAKDSIFMDVMKRKAYLYGDAHVDYGKVTIDAEYIEVDWGKDEIFAKGMPDSSGTDTIGLPVFKDGDDVFTSREMRYNFVTEKGIISEVVTKEGEGFVHGETVKMSAKDELYIGNAVYTTCNLEHPHFAINAKKIKIIPDKVAVTGPFNISVSDIQTPIGFAFGLFPLPKDQTSGVIIPEYGQTTSRGFHLRNGGFYWSINDYVGTTIKGDIYTNGSWRANWETEYKKRYAYGGKAIIAFSDNKTGFDKIPDSLKAPLGYRVYWQHSPNGSGNSKLTSSVDIKSANYNRNNNFNVNQSLQTSFSSSISYNKKFGKTPFSLDIKLRQDQTDSVQNYTLPDVNFTMQRINPLKKLGDNPKAWYSQIGIGYSMNARNKVTNLNTSIINGVNTRQINEIDFVNLEKLAERSTNGVEHSLPVTLPTVNLMKHFKIQPTVSYKETWYANKLGYGWIDSLQTAKVNDTINGFYRWYEYNYNASLTTRVYGYWEVNKLGLMRVKHTMSPRIGFRYNPDFSESRFGFYESFTDSTGEEKRFSKYSGNNYVFGGARQGESRTINFSLDNIIEAKLRSRKDTTSDFKYVKLFDNIGVSSSYNFAKDSLNFAPLRLNARTTIGGISFQINSTHDLYKIDSVATGRAYKYDEFYWEKKNLKIGRMTVASLTVSTNLNPKKRKKKYESDNEEEQEEIDYINNNIDDYVDFNIPWSMRVAYNLSLSKQFFEPTITQSITLNGDFSLTPKWKIGYRTGYDLKGKKVTLSSFDIIRDLHCWEMKFGWQPFGFNKGYNFQINVKASVLQDMKLSKKDESRNR